MKPEDLKQARDRHHRAMEIVDQELADAMLKTFEEITGKQPSDRFRDSVMDAVRFQA